MKKNISKLTLIALLLSAFAFVSCNSDDSGSLLPVTSIKVTNADDGVISLIQQDTKQVEVGFYPGNAQDIEGFTFRFTSTDNDIFTVNDEGVVTAVGVGQAVLRIEAINNINIWTLVVIDVEERIFPVTSIYIPEELRIHYIEMNSSLDLGEVVVVNPENATNPEIIFISGNEELALVNERGVVFSRDLTGNVTITVRATDGTNVEATMELRIREVSRTRLDRANWTATVSAANVPANIINGTQTDAFGGFPHQMIDGTGGGLGVIIVKPGATFSGITAPPRPQYAYFVIDMGDSQNFDFIALRHRTTNTSANLRVSEINVYVSSDGVDFVKILERAPIATAATISEVTVDLPGTFNYRYIKVEITGFLNPPAFGNTIQISDFNVGISTWVDL